MKFKEKLLCELVDKSSSSFKELKRMGCILDKTLKYFTYEFKKATNLGKFYVLPKIHPANIRLDEDVFRLRLQKTS